MHFCEGEKMILCKIRINWEKYAFSRETDLILSISGKM